MKALFIVLTLAMTGVVNAEYYPAPDYRVFGHPHTKSDEKAIDGLVAKFRKAWSEQNAKDVAAVHSSDVEWVNAFGRTFRGSQELEEFLEKRLFPAFDQVVSKREMESLQMVSRRYIGDSAAVINAHMDSERGSSVGTGSRRVSLNLVLEKQGGEWKIAHQVITDLREIRK